jgi:hypothetical protein
VLGRPERGHDVWRSVRKGSLASGDGRS